ncbi:hypothetical protein DSO57_1027398 [Entomophthora muscae]|uniref:Uncharacterized protein n=1 Tax=Entomophthora muscae TaxID=34485 RepID=A0ACC2SF39_9FUNG|nr:hypothetical protein DSO57_1027398 [Entomophthora muscae]
MRPGEAPANRNLAAEAMPVSSGNRLICWLPTAVKPDRNFRYNDRLKGNQNTPSLSDLHSKSRRSVSPYILNDNDPIQAKTSSAHVASSQSVYHHS